MQTIRATLGKQNVVWPFSFIIWTSWRAVAGLCVPCCNAFSRADACVACSRSFLRLLLQSLLSTFLDSGPLLVLSLQDQALVVLKGAIAGYYAEDGLHVWIADVVLFGV